MDLATEKKILRIINDFTQEQLEACDKEGERIYESLNDGYLAHVLSKQIFTYEDNYDESLLVIQTTPGFNNALYDLVQQLAKILYVKKCQDSYYEAPA
ncbi:hypothetical protein ARAF_2652 [Arsenophonus endosymbiont of Aleurodicus floccissimus]|uniref:hypothetical protein n=1 Tax=Arsenophonus endosymbiont of Aleurodicus floccissimus TaxID=2152761 RepID=UPI000E6B3312|nr:hypothetical protein [Arsenophonus endosymbiont of Aleurodicus floccissimus]SPP32486.1 hypothetical protein ARAF_2652 [Arsenophonus endosymbiont of Aleurodicus floccissimus]